MLYNTLKFKGKTINYRVEGRGEKTLVLLHGYMNSLQVWDKFFKAYKDEDIVLVAIDLIGHGESEVVEEVSSMELQADMIKQVLDELGIRDCVMIGHSMGGMITLSFAEQYPNYIKGFCLLHSTACEDNPKGKENRKRACKIINENKLNFIVDFIPNLFAEKNVEKYSEEIKWLKELSASTKKEGIVAAQMGMIMRKDRNFVLEQTKVPVLFVIGRQDIRADLSVMLPQACLPRNSEVMILDCGHMSFIEEEKIIENRFLSFVERCYL